MQIMHKVAYVCLLFVGAGAFAAEARKVKSDVAGGCPDGYCSDTKCSTIDHEVVCSDMEDHTLLYWETCSSISSYYQRGSNCCTTRTRCCTYYDRNDKPRNRWEDSGETIGCG